MADNLRDRVDRHGWRDVACSPTRRAAR